MATDLSKSATDLSFVSKQDFVCINCDYSCSRKGDYNKHCKTMRHLTTLSTKKSKNSLHCICGKEFKDRSGLWRHKKICTGSITKNVMDHTEPLTNMVLKLVQQNGDFQKMIMDQNKQIIELSKEKSIITTSNSNNNTITNNTAKFNLNFFLNETCKDALNITDFVNSLQLQIKDLENVGEYGFAEGISRIFTRGLKELDVNKRPIHCSDLKREILHMKNDGIWEKTNGESPKLIKAIKQVANKNISMLAEWRKENPGCEKYNSRKNDLYLKLTMESMGPTEEKETERDFGKIVRSIAKDTIIEKDGQMLL